MKSSSYVDDVRWRQTRVMCRKKTRKPKAARKNSSSPLPRFFTVHIAHLNFAASGWRKEKSEEEQGNEVYVSVQ